MNHEIRINSVTISITVNKLTIGVRVKEWASIFLLKDSTNPEQYFQSIFRVQTPYVDEDDIIKDEALVFELIGLASLMINFTSNINNNLNKLEIPKLIVKYIPIYLNGKIGAPIKYDIFYQLAIFWNANRTSLSQRIKDISMNTRILDDEIISNMFHDPNISDILKKAFSHAKFKKEKNSKKVFNILTLDENFNNNITLLGRKIGYEKGINAPIQKLQAGKDDGIKFAKK